MEQQQGPPPESCDDWWCEGSFGHMECVGERWAWALRHAGIIVDDFEAPSFLAGSGVSPSRKRLRDRTR